MRRAALLLALFAGIAHARGPGGSIMPSSGFNDETVGLGTREGIVVNARRSAPVPPGEFATPRYVSPERTRIYIAPPEGRFASVNRGRSPAIADGKPADFLAPYAWRSAPANAATAKISGVDREGRTLLTPAP